MFYTMVYKMRFTLGVMHLNIFLTIFLIKISYYGINMRKIIFSQKNRDEAFFYLFGWSKNNILNQKYFIKIYHMKSLMKTYEL